MLKMNKISRIYHQYRCYSYSHYLLKDKVSKGLVYKEQYERMDPLDHVLLRPGMYVGQMEASSVETW
jgi:hypothetical protein